MRFRKSLYDAGNKDNVRSWLSVTTCQIMHAWYWVRVNDFAHPMCSRVVWYPQLFLVVKDAERSVVAVRTVSIECQRRETSSLPRSLHCPVVLLQMIAQRDSVQEITELAMVHHKTGRYETSR